MADVSGEERLVVTDRREGVPVDDGIGAAARRRVGRQVEPVRRPVICGQEEFVYLIEIEEPGVAAGTGENEELLGVEVGPDREVDLFAAQGLYVLGRQDPFRVEPGGIPDRQEAVFAEVIAQRDVASTVRIMFPGSSIIWG